MPRRKSFRALAADFHPHDDRTQPLRRIKLYMRTHLRTPRQGFVPRFVSTADVTGPLFDPRDLASGENDLSIVAPGRPRAMGQLIELHGRVLDEDGKPVRNVLVEMWQANSAGKYIHHNDPSPVPVDPNFLGVGRAMTDDAGGFRFRTVKPGAYRVPYEGRGSARGWWRPPHIHFSLFGPSFASRLVTQVYFPGEPLNARDLIMNSVRDPGARRRLTLEYRPELDSEDGALGFRVAFVLRGRFATPFEGR